MTNAAGSQVYNSPPEAPIADLRAGHEQRDVHLVGDQHEAMSAGRLPDHDVTGAANDALGMLGGDLAIATLLDVGRVIPRVIV